VQAKPFLHWIPLALLLLILLLLPPRTSILRAAGPPPLPPLPLPPAPAAASRAVASHPESTAALAAAARPHRPLDHADSLYIAGSYLDQAHDDYGPGRLDSALVNFERSLAWDPRNATAWHGKGATLGRMHRFREARAAYDEALRLRPDYFMAWWHRGCDNAAAGE
jgi:tetratricopeptide (TPR) repeat protein